ncbi:MAG: hypothetical protein J6C20_08755 [Paludibacteraceae bacterium]|nr:hypothetical protein [Paludibacteraceae bacterium]
MLRNRKLWIDSIRAIAIIMVVFGPQIPEETSYFVYTSTVKMPLFFAISGYLFSDRGADHSDILEWHKLYDFAEVNDDGIVTEDDVKAIQKAISKKEKYNIKYDVNLDNRVNMQDVTYLQKTIANIEKKNSPYDINKDGLLSDIDLILLQTVIPVIVNYGKSLDTNKDGKVSFQDVK